MKKLKMSSLTITLYVFTLLSLAYTVYFVYTTYESLVTYYSSYGLGTAEYVAYILQNCYTPFAITIILYALAGISDMLYKILKPEVKENNEVAEGVAQPVEEPKKETVKEEPAKEEPVEEAKEELTQNSEKNETEE